MKRKQIVPEVCALKHIDIYSSLYLPEFGAFLRRSFYKNSDEGGPLLYRDWKETCLIVKVNYRTGFVFLKKMPSRNGYCLRIYFPWGFTQIKNCKENSIGM